MEVVMQRMQALEEDEDPRSNPRERRAYGQRRAYGTRREEGAPPLLLMNKRKEADEERRERNVP
jgi:hypothetical protein